MHILRWDLDRTYLDTDIHSVRGLVRAAFETAEAKRHIPGAPALLRALLDHDPSAQASILSGSPRQLRSVLEQRLILDGIRFESLILKDNLGNIRRGRFRAVRGQLGFKLPQLLSLRLSTNPDDTETLFGDDSEVDALIYALYAEALAGTLPDDQLARVLEVSGAYPDQIAHARRSLARLHRRDAVRGIWIRVDRSLPLRHYLSLGPRIRVVFSWLQAAIAMVGEDLLSPAAAAGVVLRCRDEAALSAFEVAALVQDAVRRGLTSPEGLQACLAQPSLASLVGPVSEAVSALGDHVRALPAASAPDWFAFLSAAMDTHDVADRGADG